MTILWHTMPLLLTGLCGTWWLHIRYLIEAKRLSLLDAKRLYLSGILITRISSHNLLKSFCMLSPLSHRGSSPKLPHKKIVFTQVHTSQGWQGEVPRIQRRTLANLTRIDKSPLAHPYPNFKYDYCLPIRKSAIGRESSFELKMPSQLPIFYLADFEEEFMK